MKKKIVLLALVATMVLATTACGGGAKTQETTVAETTVVETTAEPTTEEPTTEEPATEEPTMESEIETTADIEEKPEANTSEMVDYLAKKAKADAETATDEDIENAVEWLKTNTYNYFQGNENMESTMYYGELLENKYKGTNNIYEQAGWQAFKTVKYVYRGVEGVMDDVTQKNLKKLKELVNEL